MVSKISPQKIGDILIFEKSWDDLVKLITPLDLVLFSGSDLVSTFIQKIEKQRLPIHEISHVGIVVCSSIFPKIEKLEPNQWYVWESTSSLRLPGFENEVLDINGKQKLGVQIRNLKDVIQNYNGTVYLGKLINNPLLVPQERIISTPVSPFDYSFQEIFEILNRQIEVLNKQWTDLIIEVKSKKDGFSDDEKTLLDQKQKEIQQQMIILNQEIDYISNSTFEPMISNMEEKCKNLYLSEQETKKIIEKLKWLYEVYGHRIYNSSFLDLFSAMYPALRPLRSLKYKLIRKLSKIFKSKKMTENSLFCSQFVAIVYQTLGIIDPKINPQNFVPVDFLGCDEDGQTNIISLIFKVQNV
jgi:hypothetical protein